MWQWLKLFESPRQRELNELAPKPGMLRLWADFGPAHDTRAEAKAWLKSCEEDSELPSLEPGSRYRLAERELLTRSITVVEGLEDDPIEVLAPPARQGSEAPAPALEQKRKRRTKAEIEADNTAAAAGDTPAFCCKCHGGLYGDVWVGGGHAWHNLCFAELDVATQRANMAAGVKLRNSGKQDPMDAKITRANPPNCTGCNIGILGDTFVVDGKSWHKHCFDKVAAIAAGDQAAVDGELCAHCKDPIGDSKVERIGTSAWHLDCWAELSPGVQAELADSPASESLATVEAVEVSLPPPAPPPAPAEELAAALAPVPTAPHVTLDGLIFEVFDGNAWYWQRYQVPASAEKMAKKVAELLEAGATAEPGKLQSILLTLKSGRAPAKAAT